MDTSSSSVIKRHLIEPIKLEANIKRSLLPSCNEIPIIDCSATLDFVKVFLLFVSRCSYFLCGGNVSTTKWGGLVTRHATTHNALVSFAEKKKMKIENPLRKMLNFFHHPNYPNLFSAIFDVCFWRTPFDYEWHISYNPWRKTRIWCQIKIITSTW